MQFLYQYPETNGSSADLLDAGPVAELAVVAEAAGWDGFGFTEHPAPGARWLESGGHQTLDPFVALGYVAAVTTRLRLLTYLTVVPYRNPLLLAKAAATVDKLSGGRFILGTGTGYLRGEFRSLGVDFDERNELFDEALDVLPLHWSGEPFSYEGKHFTAKDVLCLPRPVQQPIPIWIGGNAKLTRRRVAERAQGWMPLIGPAEMLTTTRTPSVGSLAGLGALVAEVKEMAGARAGALDFAYAYDDPTFALPTVDIERHRDAFGRMAEAGLTWVVAVGPAAVPPASQEWIQAVGETYLAGPAS